MGKSESKKVRNHIPNDLAYSVLSKLPLKSLKRFECVYKPWSLLFQSPHFMNKFRTNFISNSHSYYNDTSLILYQDLYLGNYTSSCSFYSLSGEKYENRVKLDLPNPFQHENPFFYFFDSDIITGTLCLQKGTTLVLWNPATHEFKVTPPSPIESMPPYREVDIYFHGFGFDHVRDDLKIIRYIYFSWIEDLTLQRLGVRREDVPRNEISYEPLWEIYSLRDNSWRKLEVNMPKFLEYSSSWLNMDGMCHWWSRSENPDEDFLVSFNLSNEMFFTTTMPLDIPSVTYPNFLFRFVMRHLVVLNGSIASISWYLSDNTTYHISILGEVGVKESWTKLFVVGPLSYIERIIGAGKNGDIFFQKKDGQLVCFDLSTQKTKQLGFKGEHIAIYKKNLVSFGGINH